MAVLQIVNTKPVEPLGLRRPILGSRGRENGLTALFFFMSAVCWSPLLPRLLAINSSAAFLGAFLGVFVLIRCRHGVTRELLAALLLSLCVALLAVTQSTTFLARVLPIPFLLLASSYVVERRWLPIKLCHWLSIFLSAAVVLAWVGFIYAYFGGSPLFTIQNTDGRDNSLYLATMTNFSVGNVIRPAFIYDEPGAFSFMLCATVGLRELLRMSRGFSWFLLVGGLITLSMMHLVIVVLFLAFRFGIGKTVLVGSLLAGLTYGVLQNNAEFAFLLARFEVVDGKLSGDNRSEQIENLMAVIDSRMFLFGDVKCHTRPDRVCEEHGDISSSPATPVYRGGVLMLLAQLCVHGLLALAFVKRRSFRFTALTLFLLFLQRPYFEGYGYGMMLYVQLFLMFPWRVPRQSQAADVFADR